MDFPKINNNKLKGTIGEKFFQYFVYDNLKCIYHENHEETDFGLDGYIEIVNNNNVTGKMVGVQVKHGDSFFSRNTQYGYTYIDDNKHLNYYMNSQIPVFIIIMDNDYNRMNWIKFDISKTLPYDDNHWCIEIPKDNTLETNFYEAIMNSIEEIVDYEEEIGRNWVTNSALKGCDKRIIGISKMEIFNMNFDVIFNIIDRITMSKKVLIGSRGTLNIFFPEYAKDTREIFEIPEITDWLKMSIDIGIPWFYLLDYNNQNSGLSLLLNAYCKQINIIRDGNQYLISHDRNSIKVFFEKNFDNLNRFMLKHNIDKKINIEITDRIMKYYGYK